MGDGNGNGLVTQYGNLLVPSLGKVGIFKGEAEDLPRNTWRSSFNTTEQRSSPWARVDTRWRAMHRTRGYGERLLMAYAPEKERMANYFYVDSQIPIIG